MLTRLGHTLLIFTLLTATGAHWVALQSLAWTSMLAENLRTSTWDEAIERTFDGKHPCCLCKKIASGKQTETKAEFRVEWKKFEFSYARPVFVFSPPTHFHEQQDATVTPYTLTHTPPVPPPRTLQG